MTNENGNHNDLTYNDPAFRWAWEIYKEAEHLVHSRTTFFFAAQSFLVVAYSTFAVNRFNWKENQGIYIIAMGIIVFTGIIFCDALPWLDRMWWFQRVDDLPVWSISCFFVRRDYRRQGIMTQLLAAAVKTARRAKASALEAYPIDTSASKSSSNIFVASPGVRQAME